MFYYNNHTDDPARLITEDIWNLLADMDHTARDLVDTYQESLVAYDQLENASLSPETFEAELKAADQETTDYYATLALFDKELAQLNALRAQLAEYVGQPKS